MGKRFVTAREIDELVESGSQELVVDRDTVLTDMGRERARERSVRIVKSAAPVSVTTDKPELAASVRAAIIKQMGSEPAGLDAAIAAVLQSRL